MVVQRWFPALGLAAGLSLMAMAAIAQQEPPAGQPAPQAMPHRPGPGGGPMQQGGGWHRPGMDGMRPMMDPAKFCTERYAHQVGFLAYLGAKLGLTAQQQPLWDSYYKSMTDAAGKLRETCLDNGKTPMWTLTAPERRDRMEKSLSTKLDALHSTRPAFDALYQSLSADQKPVLDHPRPHHRGPGR